MNEQMTTMPVKAVPYTHQMEAYGITTRLKRAALLMEQGTGKTMVTIGTLGYRWANDGLSYAVIVAPVSVIPVWHRELEKFADYPYEVAVLDKGSTKARAQIAALVESPGPALKIALVSYQTVWRIKDDGWAPMFPAMNGGQRYRVMSGIVCDESQKIKTPFAKQSKFMHLLGKFAEWKYILTGTPVSNGPEDFWSQCHFLQPGLLPTYYRAFRARYLEMGGYDMKEIVGYKNLDELTTLVHSVSYRVTKEEALDLPEIVQQIRYCYLPPDARRIYKEMVKSDLAMLESGELKAGNVLTRLLRLSQITGGYVKNETGVDVVHDMKVRELMDIVDETPGKIVVFARFIAEIDAIKQALREKCINYTYIVGDLDTQAREDMVTTFQTDPKCKVMIAQLQAAGLGITLTAANTAVFFSLNYSYMDYEQCGARIHRIGQDHKCTFIHLLAHGTIDEDIMDILERKGNMAHLVVDDWKTLLKKRK